MPKDLNIGHINKNGHIQPLEDHLRNTAELAEEFASKINLKDAGYAIGLLHDIGKASSKFSEYILNESNLKRGEIDHSTAGAQYLYNNFHKKELTLKETHSKRMAYQMMELCIASHHSGLIDCISNLNKGIQDNYLRRMTKSSDDTRIDECVPRLDHSILADVDTIADSAAVSLASLIDKIRYDIKTCDSEKNTKLKSLMFRYGLLCRFLLSCLIDADCTDTKNYMEGLEKRSEYPDWSTLISRYYEYTASLNNDDLISQIRQNISDQCCDASLKDKGIFTLSVPTGGGKTLSSLRFALEHLKKHNMERIIYVIPYTSIIDQNASVMRKALEQDGEDIILEYHSNIDIGMDTDSETDTNAWKYLSDSWDCPIILTTMVQFLDTFFSQGAKRTRRLHNLSNSVIIFDEIQTIPVNTIYMFNEAVNFLVEYCGSTVLLCTATQPLLGKNIEYPLKITPDSEIISDVKELSKSLKRTEIKYLKRDGDWTENDIADLALDKVSQVDSILIITNTKKMAKSIHQIIKNKISPDVCLYHLSANMCPAHRKDILNLIKGALGNKKVICVSTQLIEAGIDVDFNAVIRCMAGLDSIIQAAGRCNREGKMDENGEVYVVKSGENLGSLTDILEGRRCAGSIFENLSEDVLDPSVIEQYFHEYFYTRKKDMEYTNGHNSSLFMQLSVNIERTNAYYDAYNKRPETLLPQSFKEANQTFQVIEKMNSVIVDYNEESHEIICRLCSDIPSHVTSNLLRRAQKYAVNTYEFESLLKMGAVKEVSLNSGIFYLLDGYYDYEYGLSDEQKMQTMIV